MDSGLDNRCKRVRFKIEWNFASPGANMTGETAMTFESTGAESCTVTTNISLTIHGCCLKCMPGVVGTGIQKGLNHGEGILSDKVQRKLVGEQIGTNEWNRISNQGDYSSTPASNIVESD